ncbi:unnamed protein product, partial [Schistosoma turkestanicum]
LTKSTIPISSYSSLRDIDDTDQSRCFYCHNRLPSCTHQLNLLQPTNTTNNNVSSMSSIISTNMMGNRQKSTSAIPSCSTYEIRPATPGKLTDYEHEFYNPLSTNHSSYFYNPNHTTTTNNNNSNKLLFPSNFCHDNLHSLTTNQCSSNFMSNVQCSSSSSSSPHVCMDLNQPNHSCTQSIPITTTTTTSTTHIDNPNPSLHSIENNVPVQSLDYLCENTCNENNYTDKSFLIQTDNHTTNNNNVSNIDPSETCTKIDRSHSDTVTGGSLQRISLYFTNDTQQISTNHHHQHHYTTTITTTSSTTTTTSHKEHILLNRGDKSQPFRSVI